MTSSLCHSPYIRRTRFGVFEALITEFAEMARTVRKAPSAKTLRQLYLLSGNLCANPKCNTVLVNANGTMVADVCHIRAESRGGPRFDNLLTEEQRRNTKNLLLLCSAC